MFQRRDAKGKPYSSHGQHRRQVDQCLTPYLHHPLLESRRRVFLTLNTTHQDLIICTQNISHFDAVSHNQLPTSFLHFGNFGFIPPPALTELHQTLHLVTAKHLLPFPYPLLFPILGTQVDEPTKNPYDLTEEETPMLVCLSAPTALEVFSCPP